MHLSGVLANAHPAENVAGQFARRGNKPTVNVLLVAVGAFGDKKAPFPAGFVKFFAENTRFRLQNLPIQPEK